MGYNYILNDIAEIPVEIPTISMDDNELETVNQAMHPAEMLTILMRSEHNTSITETPTIEILPTEATIQQTTEANASIEINENNSNTSNAIDVPTNINDLWNIVVVPETTTATTTTSTTTTAATTTTTTTTATIAQKEFEFVVNNNNDNISISVLESSQTNVNSQSIADSTLITSSTSTMHPTEVKSSTPSVAEIILGEIESISKSPEPDNYIYETYSSVPLTVNNESPPIQAINVDSFASIVDPTNEQLSKAEEPPETIAVDVATAA